jgi:hypothetical protein
MRTKLPPDGAVSMLICDDIRSEKDGRVSLMGIFAGRRINLPAPADGEKRQLPRLGIYIEIEGGKGTVDTAISIVSPGGQVVHEANLPGLGLSEDMPSVIIGQIGGPEFSEDGKYEMRLTMDGKKTYIRSITISSSAVTAPAED